jgi:hypothetical protein
VATRWQIAKPGRGALFKIHWPAMGQNEKAVEVSGKRDSGVSSTRSSSYFLPELGNRPRGYSLYDIFH